MVDDFSAASLRLQRAGFTGVEISAGHGHLFHQFLSPQSNHRDDMYGGDLEGRTKFLSDVINAVRQTCGLEFMIGLKLPGEDGMKGGIDLAGAQQIAQTVVTPDTVDYVSFCWPPPIRYVVLAYTRWPFSTHSLCGQNSTITSAYIRCSGYVVGYDC